MSLISFVIGSCLYNQSDLSKARFLNALFLNLLMVLTKTIKNKMKRLIKKSY